MGKRLKVALALSAGGARGYAHIGVLEAIKKFSFEITAIAGSSMGAVVGGIFAAGKLDIYREWVETLQKVDVIRLLIPAFSKRGIFKEDKVMNYLKNLIGECNIEDFKIKFTAVAVDLVKKKEIWITKGSLYNALKASTAIPGMFTPVIQKDMILVDGGVLNPLPIAPVLNSQADLIIAVNCSSDRNMNRFKESFLEKNSLPLNHLNLLYIMLQSIYLMQDKITNYQLANYSPDILIEIPRSVGGIFDFHRAKEIIEVGKEIAEKTIEDFLKNFNN